MRDRQLQRTGVEILEPVASPDASDADPRIRVLGGDLGCTLELLARFLHESDALVETAEIEMELGPFGIEECRLFEVLQGLAAGLEGVDGDARSRLATQGLGALGPGCGTRCRRIGHAPRAGRRDHQQEPVETDGHAPSIEGAATAVNGSWRS